MSTIITLLTDFGTQDSYVAEVKAVLASQAHPALIVDITHDVPRGDIRAAQYTFSRVWHRFPRGTVHLVVVDPGVGTARRALAAEAGGQYFVAPDNGLLSPLPADARFAELPIPPAGSPTFQARDLFAPAAAQLANGTALSHVGRVIADPLRVPLPTALSQDGATTGEVVYVDRFGTLVTNILGVGLDPSARIEVQGRDVGVLQRTFGDVTPGALLAFVGSGGTVEIAARDGSAARDLGMGVGTMVLVRRTTGRS